MPSELFINAVEVGTNCQWPFWTKIAAIPPAPQSALWETVAHIDDRSPNFYYQVKFSVFILDLTPVTAKITVSELRDAIGEGPVPGVFTHPDAIVAFEDLHWVTSPDTTQDGIRADLIEIEFYTLIKPVSGPGPP